MGFVSWPALERQCWQTKWVNYYSLAVDPKVSAFRRLCVLAATSDSVSSPLKPHLKTRMPPLLAVLAVVWMSASWPHGQPSADHTDSSCGLKMDVELTQRTSAEKLQYLARDSGVCNLSSESLQRSTFPVLVSDSTNGWRNGWNGLIFAKVESQAESSDIQEICWNRAEFWWVNERCNCAMERKAPHKREWREVGVQSALILTNVMVVLMGLAQRDNMAT